MTFVVPSSIEVLMNKITLWISIRANDWTAKRAIIASNGVFSPSYHQEENNAQIQKQNSGRLLHDRRKVMNV